ncbi:MAG TPA: amidohydrolase family protein [Patescibacteria group bacterium]|nr:amidohydrolase family protein [Patescibacteria group bacterium]
MALQRFPGFIDMHVHLREPGATNKEDFASGSRAAIKGGFTFVCDMPNNPGCPTISSERLNEKVSLADSKALCDTGFHFGTDGHNLASFGAVIRDPHVFGLKVYCGKTTGDLMITDPVALDAIFAAWESDKPILVHAQGDILGECVDLAAHYHRRIHICHVVTQDDVGRVKTAKEHNLIITCGVTPHHLFLTEGDVAKLGAFALFKPPIGSKQDQEMLWESIQTGIIDIIESDHAPHTKEEKVHSTPCFGVPGLETTIPLLVHAIVEKKLTTDKMIDLLYTKPKKIFTIPDQPNTFIELDPVKPYVVGSTGYETKCGWSPFDGWELSGCIERVVLRGKLLVDGGKIV